MSASATGTETGMAVLARTGVLVVAYLLHAFLCLCSCAHMCACTLAQPASLCCPRSQIPLARLHLLAQTWLAPVVGSGTGSEKRPSPGTGRMASVHASAVAAASETAIVVMSTGATSGRRRGSARMTKATKVRQGSSSAHECTPGHEHAVTCAMSGNPAVRWRAIALSIRCAEPALPLDLPIPCMACRVHPDSQLWQAGKSRGTRRAAATAARMRRRLRRPSRWTLMRTSRPRRCR